MPGSASADAHVYTVGELLGGLRRLIEERVGWLWVVGEISNLHSARSGHSYFTLKDDAGQIRAALFRSAARRLAFDPEDGLEVLVYGEVSIYEARGDLQLIVHQLEPRGRGALQIAFEQLRRRLEGEGLFDPARKRALPPLPARLGVVTSPTGAALRDVLEVTGRRFPSVPISVAATRVQGAGAEVEIAAALDVLGARGDVDLILLVRGGGSLEDLQPFNTETVARAIVRAPVPVLTGVGHEVDVTIADLAADLRAPTPSAAAELALPDRSAARSQVARSTERLRRAALGRLERMRERLARERDALRAVAPSARLANQRTRLRAAGRGLGRGIRARAERARGRFTALAAQLDALSPLAILDRGYALVRRQSDGALVLGPDQVSAGDRVAIRVAEAEVDAAVEAVRPLARRGKPL
jgi:exodeoxyribonuclease VII large subunit